jgi:hypothetical protein
MTARPSLNKSHKAAEVGLAAYKGGLVIEKPVLVIEELVAYLVDANFVDLSFFGEDLSDIEAAAGDLDAARLDFLLTLGLQHGLVGLAHLQLYFGRAVFQAKFKLTQASPFAAFAAQTGRAFKNGNAGLDLGEPMAVVAKTELARVLT